MEGMGESEPFRLLIDGVKDYAIFMLHADGTVASWNVGAERITGYTAEEITGSHIRRFFPPDEVADGRPERELRAAAEQGRTEGEGWRLRKDGSRFWANTILTALRDDAGKLSGFARITRDATEQKRAREERERLIEAMEAQRRLFEMVLEHAPAGIAIFDGSSLAREVVQPHVPPAPGRAVARNRRDRDAHGRPGGGFRAGRRGGHFPPRGHHPPALFRPRIRAAPRRRRSLAAGGAAAAPHRNR